MFGSEKKWKEGNKLGRRFKTKKKDKERRKEKFVTMWKRLLVS